MGETATRTEDGVDKVYSTPKPYGTTTYFTGAGDDIVNNIIGSGAELIFKLTSSDTIKTVDLEFIEDVWLKDGYIMIDQIAPLGAYLNVLIVHPVAGIVGSFGRKIWLHGSGEVVLNTDDRGKLDKGLILRVEVYNSDGTGDKDTAAAFVVSGRIELYRKITV